MKNFPDHNKYNNLEKRLQAYTEQPDDLVWENIDHALRPGRMPLWFPWIDRGTLVTIIVLIALLIRVESTVVSPLLGIKEDHQRAESNPKEPESLHESLQESEGSISSLIKGSDESDSYLKKNIKSYGDNNNSNHATNGGSLDIRNSKLEGAGLSNRFSDAITLFSSKLNFADVAKDKEVMDSVIPFSLQAQDDSSIQKTSLPKDLKRVPKRGLTFYASVTPTLAFQRIIPVNNDGIVVSKFYNSSILSSERFGVNVDFGVQGHISKRLEFYGGLLIYQQRQHLRYAFQSEDHVNLESTDDLSYMVTPQNRTRELKYEMLNLGMNAGLIYHLRGTTLTHKVGVGLSYQHGFKKGSMEAYDNSGSRYLFYQLFYRNEVRISPRLRVFVQPTFSHSIYSHEKLSAPFNLKPSRAGLGFGILYDF